MLLQRLEIIAVGIVHRPVGRIVQTVRAKIAVRVGDDDRGDLRQQRLEMHEQLVQALDIPRL